MIEPRQDGADRVSGVEKRPLSTTAAGSGIAILLVVGLLLRLLLAYVLLPGSGFESDIGTFTAWALQLGQTGPGSFYATAKFADYPPGYLYVLWIVGVLGNILAPLAHGDVTAVTEALIKIPPILADIAIGYVLYRVVLAWRAGRSDAPRLALIAAALYVFNPVTWYDSAIWGQTDAVGTLMLLLTVLALIRGNAEGASVLAVLAAVVKPQFGVVALPLVGIVLLRRHLLHVGDMPRNPVLLPARLRAWFEFERGPWRLVSSAVAALFVLVVVLIPFSLDVPGFLAEMAKTAGGYPYLTVNAYNPWAMIGSGGNAPLAFGGGWSSDTIPLLGPLPGVLIGGALLAMGYALAVLRLAWQDDRRSILIVTLLLALGFFILPTRVHERYMFPIFAILPIIAVVNRRWLWAGIALAIGAFINMHGVLTTPLYATDNVSNLPLGEFFREPLAIMISVGLSLAGFVFIAWSLRPSAVDELDEYELPLADMADGGHGADGATGDGGGDEFIEPNVPRAPWYAPLVALVPSFSIRRDRSAGLIGELGGEISRRDLALILLVFVAALLLRTFRLDVPYGMHFDEVYHARTAMEFLQDWRYGMPHSIYEFTHPHLAKYGMAVGIETLGNYQVTSTTDLNTPVSDTATEKRWTPDDAQDAHFGDRLYVATGSDVRAYDLEQPGPPLVATITGGPYVAVAIDPATHTLYTAAADGSIGQLSTISLDQQRAAGGPAVQLTTESFGAMSGMTGDVVKLLVSGGDLVGMSSGGTLVSIETDSGRQTGRTELPGVADMTGFSSKSTVVVDPAVVSDRTQVATKLADLLDDSATRIEELIASANGPVAVAGFVGDKADDVQSQIDDGQLAGVSIEDGNGLAVAVPAGVDLLDVASLAPLKNVAIPGGTTGLALVTEGPEKPTIYAANGDQLVTIRLPDDGIAGIGDRVPMPNQVTKVYWDDATSYVHVLGTSQDGSSPTIYAVEPRGNSVFADARLPFEPQVAVMDTQRDRPAEDRNDLLAFSPVGEMATVDTGSIQFGYRFPGVLLGALTAALIYLLARFLFKRRSIAVIAAVLVLVDGMFFANSRIAMNDVYVNFFMVAAFTVFVPIWLGRWRRRWVTAGGLLTVGVLLGLALASKWVGLYAMGAVGLLVLLRSALGRWIALATMILMTGVLGYMAITPNPTVANPQINYTFLLIMVVLTVLLAIGITLRPVRMTRDEFRFAVAVPVLAGVLALAYGSYRLLAGLPAAEGALLPPARIVVIGIAGILVGLIIAGVGWYLGRRGRGPLATAETVDPNVEPASPPPERGWLRPGSGFLGLPWILALLILAIVPLVVYVISYVPWINLGNQWFAGFPVGHTGQTFLDLQNSMYDYHTFQVREAHPAASPWWAWALDLKPVWFEQNDYAGHTTAVIYDTGNIVSFWLSIPAVAWACWQAWKRRSLALTFVVISLFCMWLPWARVDRATFQYHFFTILPFSFMALAYFLADLWHGPSPRTWRLAKAAAGLAIIGAPLLWLLRLPLCQIADTEQVNKGTEVCASLAREFQLTDFQVLGMVLAIGALVAAGLLLYQMMRTGSSRVSGPPDRSAVRSLALPIAFSVALLGAVLVIVGAGLPGTGVFEAKLSAEVPAFVALLLLCVPAYFVLQGRDPRRYVVGVLVAATVWFVAFYPNIGSLPVPTALSQIHLGFLPTWNWGFQFGLNLDQGNRDPLDLRSIALLSVAVTGVVVAAIYAARSRMLSKRPAAAPVPTSWPEASEIDSSAAPEPEPGPGLGSDPDPDPEPRPESEPDSGQYSGPTPEPAPRPEPEPEPDAESEPTSESPTSPPLETG